MVIAMFVVLELIVNNVLEPWLYGTEAGVAPLPLLIATLFWTWLWGPIGLLLAVPMTVCVAVLARHAPRLSFLDTLLTDKPLLEDNARFHQHVVSLEFDEAFDVARAYQDEHSLLDTYERLVLPSLRQVEHGRHTGTIDEDRAATIHNGLSLLIADIVEDAQIEPANGRDTVRQPAFGVVCVPARDKGDELVGRMLCQLLHERGVEATALAAGLLVSEVIDVIEEQSAYAVCVSALPPSTIGEARHLCMRLTERMPGCSIVVGIWEAKSADRIAKRLSKSDRVQPVTKLAEALKALSSSAMPSQIAAASA
jgi:hypothetical protein